MMFKNCILMQRKKFTAINELKARLTDVLCSPEQSTVDLADHWIVERDLIWLHFVQLSEVCRTSMLRRNENFGIGNQALYKFCFNFQSALFLAAYGNSRRPNRFSNANIILINLRSQTHSHANILYDDSLVDKLTEFLLVLKP